MENLKVQQLVLNIEKLLNEFKSAQITPLDTQPLKKDMYSIEEFVEVSPYKSPTSIYRILDKLELGASWKKDIGIGKPRLFYSQETVNAVLKFIDDRDDNRGTLVAI